jgi:hypothetical protein
MQIVYVWESELQMLWSPKGLVHMMMPDVGKTRAVANIGQVTHGGGGGVTLMP